MQVQLLDWETIGIMEDGADGITAGTGETVAIPCWGTDKWRAPEVEEALSTGGKAAASRAATSYPADIWPLGMVFLLIITEVTDVNYVSFIIECILQCRFQLNWVYKHRVMPLRRDNVWQT